MAGRLERAASPTVNRLADRASTGGLRRRTVAGGEVYTGETATRALQALGARAMTVDQSIIVDETFDPARPEDAALLAHEQYHLEHSGGVSENAGRDHEEVAARQVERMVLHRLKSTGGVESHEAGHTSSSVGTPASPGSGQEEGRDSADASGASAQRGYQALLRQGLTHDEIVHMLAREVLLGTAHQKEGAAERGGRQKGIL